MFLCVLLTSSLYKSLSFRFTGEDLEYHVCIAQEGNMCNLYSTLTNVPAKMSVAVSRSLALQVSIAYL